MKFPFFSITNWDRIALGLILAGFSGAEIVGACTRGHASFGWFQVGFAEHPITFSGLIAVWLLTFVGGISWVKDGVIGLWQRATGSGLS